jgi:hypothetical protein
MEEYIDKYNDSEVSREELRELNRNNQGDLYTFARMCLSQHPFCIQNMYVHDNKIEVSKIYYFIIKYLINFIHNNIYIKQYMIDKNTHDSIIILYYLYLSIKLYKDHNIYIIYNNYNNSTEPSFTFNENTQSGRSVIVYISLKDNIFNLLKGEKTHETLYTTANDLINSQESSIKANKKYLLI